MKTSNILMIAAIFILLSSIMVYNFSLKAEYLKADKLGIVNYKKTTRFNEYEQINIKPFNRIELKAANLAGISIEYGEKEAIWIRKHGKDMFDIKQDGEKLVVDLNKKGKAELYRDWGHAIVILSPRINSLTTHTFTPAGKKMDYWNIPEIAIRGFLQDSLTIFTAGHTKVKLYESQINFVNVAVGDKSADGVFKINSDNKIGTLKLTIFGKSNAEILAENIQNFEHHISDSASLTVNGIILNKIKQ